MPTKHATEEDLGLYALARLQGERLESIEEHLLTCSICAAQAMTIEQEASLLREALRQSEAEKMAESSRTVPGGKLLKFKRRLN